MLTSRYLREHRLGRCQLVRVTPDGGEGKQHGTFPADMPQQYSRSVDLYVTQGCCRPRTLAGSRRKGLGQVVATTTKVWVTLKCIKQYCQGPMAARARNKRGRPSVEPPWGYPGLEHMDKRTASIRRDAIQSLLLPKSRGPSFTHCGKAWPRRRLHMFATAVRQWHDTMCNCRGCDDTRCQPECSSCVCGMALTNGTLVYATEPEKQNEWHPAQRHNAWHAWFRQRMLALTRGGVVVSGVVVRAAGSGRGGQVLVHACL